MSFSTLPPDSRTLVSKWNTKLALIWKEDFGPLGNSPVLLLLSPGKTPLTTTVAKFFDTSVCGALDALTPASVHSLWSSPKFLNRFCLTILIRLRFSRLVLHLFLPLNFLFLLGHSTPWTASFFGYEWLSSGQLLDRQSSPWLCSLANQTVRPFWRLRKTFAGVLSWLADWHVTIFKFVEMQMSWRPLSKKPGLPYHLSSATNWSPPRHAALRQQLKQKPLPSIEYIYSKWTYCPEGQQFTKKIH